MRDGHEVTPLEARVVKALPGFRLDAELTLDDGITALFGPSGSGKTTLLRCLAGLLRPDDGRIVRGGQVLFDAAAGVDLAPERRRIGFVFQDLRLFPHLDVARNLDYGRRARSAMGVVNDAGAAGAPGQPADRDHVIELLELGALLGRSTAGLSGGEAQRVALGRAILSGPSLLFLDEPLTGLDDARKGAVLDLLGRVRTELGLPMLLVSHSLADILQLTTRMIVMDGGRIVGAGELQDVLGQEAVFRLADSLGLESLLEVEVVRHDTESGITVGALAGREISLPPTALPPGTRALVAIRPEDVILARAPVSGISAQNAFEGTVTDVHHLPDRVLVSIDVGGTIRSEITERSTTDLGIVPGARIHCLVKTLSFKWRRAVGPPR